MTLAAMLRAAGAIERGQFVLASGQRSSYYVDIKKASCRPEILREIARRVAAMADGHDLVAGMELGAVPIATAVSLEARIPFLIVRKRPKGHGTGNRIEGVHQRGQHVLLVEDVATTGASLVETVKVLREAGLTVDRGAVVVDRDQGAIPALAAVGVELRPLATVRELLGE
ncbi:MAG TPA: orotate phosphoribosyltransferase [Candidatus Thermoplasmatota archaeon]|nr:orotate phosphoribosyltransferase [Candidatus Thermoplasmatota archaeon]